MNMSWTTRELDVSCSWTLRDTRDMVRIGTHNPALSRRVHDEFTNSSRMVHDPVAKFCRGQNFENFKILVPTWHAVTTGLRTHHASWRLVYTLARLQSCQCVPQNRASVKLALHSFKNKLCLCARVINRCTHIALSVHFVIQHTSIHVEFTEKTLVLNIDIHSPLNDVVRFRFVMIRLSRFPLEADESVMDVTLSTTGPRQSSFW